MTRKHINNMLLSESNYKTARTIRLYFVNIHVYFFVTHTNREKIERIKMVRALSLG